MPFVDSVRVADHSPRMSYFGSRNVLFGDLPPNTLLFDLTVVASSYYVSLGLETYSLAGREHVRRRIRSHKQNRSARPLSRRLGNDDSPNPETTALTGYALIQHIKRTSHDLLQIEEGSLYPALQQLLKAELVKAEWGISSTNRRVRIYKLTPAGAKHLEREVSRFERMLEGITRVLAPGES